MEITVLFFGALAEITGKEKLYIQHLKDTNSVLEYFTKEFPSIKNETYSIALNRELVNENCLINAGDEIAFLPPFAGG